MKPTAAEVRDRLSYDPDTGLLTWRKARERSLVGKVAGSISGCGYRCIGFGGTDHYAHRLIWLHVYGVWPDGEIDHIDGNPSNNRLNNLRDVSRKINGQNMRRAKRTSASGLLGAHAHQGKFKAEICVDGTAVHLGVFDTADAAHAAYLAAKRELHPGCTI